MVRFPEIVLYVVILGRDAQLYELVLECAALLKKTVHFTFDFHILPSCSSGPFPGLLVVLHEGGEHPQGVNCVIYPFAHIST